MAEVPKQIAELAAKNPNDKDHLQRGINIADRQIDQLVYELYGLTEEEGNHQRKTVSISLATEAGVSLRPCNLPMVFTFVAGVLVWPDWFATTESSVRVMLARAKCLWVWAALLPRWISDHMNLRAVFSDCIANSSRTEAVVFGEAEKGSRVFS